jgi:hypothetical protein
MIFRIDSDCVKVRMMLLELYITFILLKYVQMYRCMFTQGNQGSVYEFSLKLSIGNYVKPDIL